MNPFTKDLFSPSPARCIYEHCLPDNVWCLLFQNYVYCFFLAFVKWRDYEQSRENFEATAILFSLSFFRFLQIKFCIGILLFRASFILHLMAVNNKKRLLYYISEDNNIITGKEIKRNKNQISDDYNKTIYTSSIFLFTFSANKE